MILIGLAALYVLLGCWSGLRALRRDGLNRVAVIAILLFFLSVGIFGAAKSTGFFLWPDWPVGAGLRLLSLVLGTVAAALGLIALGLHDRARHRAGRLHAFGTLLAGGAVAAYSALDFSAMVREVATNAARPFAVPVVAAEEETPIVPNDPPKPAKPPLVVKEEGSGFQMDLPQPWTVHTDKSEGGKTVYRRTWPEVYFTTISERLFGKMPVEQYAELAWIARVR